MKRIFKKRRLEGKTDYRRRLILLKGNCQRLAIRKSNKYLFLQIIESETAQDKVVDCVSTKDLLEYGWPKDKIGSLKSLGASYLAGYLLGKKSKADGKFILDSGLIQSTKGSRIYAAVKGFSDSGKDIKIGKDAFPQKERIEKDNFFNKVKEEIEKGAKKAPKKTKIETK